MDIYAFLLLGHLIGTVLGVGGATFVEIQLNNALKDGKVSPEEGVMLGSAYKTVRVGLILGLLTGFGFLILYKTVGQTFRLYDPVLWAKIVMIVIIAINAVLLQAHKMSLYWGSAISFVSWWAVAFLGFFLTNGVKYSFVSIMVTYVVTVVVGAVILHKMREHNKQKTS